MEYVTQLLEGKERELLHELKNMYEDCSYHTEVSNKRKEVKKALLILHDVINPVKKDIKCSTCVKCELYENNITSDRFFCKDSEEFIGDIEQDYCKNHKEE